MAKISSLTPDQIAKMPAYVDKWVKTGLSTDRCDRKQVQQDVIESYKVANLAAPKEFFWFDSPMSAMLGVSAYMYAKEKKKELKDLTLADMKEVAALKVVNFCMYGSHEVGWISFYDFMRTELGLVEETEKIQAISRVNANCGWWWCYADVVFLSERPISYARDGLNRLHNESGPAIEYADGYKLWFIGGVAVDEKIVMHPETLKVSAIKSESNMEKKRIMIERFGTGKYLDAIKAKVIDMDLIKVDHFDADSPAMPRSLMRTPDGEQYLCGTDGSTHRVYYMNVDPTAKTCAEAHKGISGGIDESDILCNS